MPTIILQARGLLHERTARGNKLLRVSTPRLVVTAEVDVNETTGDLIGPTITEVAEPSSLSRIKNVTGRRFRWPLPVYVRVGERRAAAQFVNASNFRIDIEITTLRVYRTTPCKNEPRSGRPRAQPFYRLLTRQVLLFDYRLDAEWWEYKGKGDWEFKGIEKGPVTKIEDRGHTGPQVALTDLTSRTPCVLLPRGAAYSRVEEIGAPIVHQIKLTEPVGLKPAIA